MSAIRKIAIAIVTLTATISAIFLAAGTATADCGWNTPVPCATTAK
jgi:hypothetical protein